MKSLLLAAVVALAAVPAHAQTARPDSGRWITLGTQGGPIPLAGRSQPANALVIGDSVYLVDAGDGAAEQLAKAGIPLARVKAVLISHLHFDHTAGLFGIVSLRWQTSVASPVTIYGPPGTRALVDGILASMQPSVQAGFAYPGEARRPADTGITVTEIRDGASFALCGAQVTTARNSHYSFAAGSSEDRAHESLAFRFDLAGRSIAYTGDTGPSPAVEKLARGVDLLVSEMIDFDRTVAEIRAAAPNMPAAALAGLQKHLRDHHLTPEQLGQMAEAAQAKSVVVTHLSAPALDGATALEYLEGIARHYRGPVAIARDLDAF